jgi:penicillin amidase
MIPYEYLPHCLNPERGYLVTANHRTIQSFYRVPFGNMTGSSGDTDRGLRIKQRIAEHLETEDQLTPDDVLAIQYDTVNVWKREIVRLGCKILQTDPDRLSPAARRAARHLQNWYDDRARSDLSVPGTELVNEMNVIFRGGVSELVRRYGGGVSGLAAFAKSVRQRDAADDTAPVPDEECEFVDQALAQAWKRAEAKYGPDPGSWHGLARELHCRQTLGYMESLDGFPALDSRFDVPLPLLRTVDGGTILSQRAQAYTQFVRLDDPDRSLTLLPIGNSDNPRSPYRTSTYSDWSQGRLHPGPLSRQAVVELAVSQQTLGREPRLERDAAPARGGLPRATPAPRGRARPSPLSREEPRTPPR